MSAQQFERFGKYLLLEKLATGGMAEVFLARSAGTSGIAKFFAIKRILPQYAESQEFIDMFKDEAKIAINLNHSNIVSIHEFGVQNNQFFLVMDYVEGRNLRQILNKMKKSNVQFSIDQIVYMVKEVAAGLDHAHRCLDAQTGKPLNITHRDMSPQNVMVSFEGEVKIVDFGIAKAESQLENTRAGTLKGKFGYMSPEQADGQPIDLRTDIFSLGICLWELLANDRLFSANNELNTLRKIRDCQIPSLRKINPNIHAEIERITQKALARDRNLRYQTAAAFHRDLNRFLNRQYPDFSPQDFSVFIKSIFAEDIMNLRKRLVDYSKLNGEAPPEPTTDRTSVTDTQTNSFVVTDSLKESVEVNTQTKTNPTNPHLSADLIPSSPTTNATMSHSAHTLAQTQSVSQVDDDSTEISKTPAMESVQPTKPKIVLDENVLKASTRKADRAERGEYGVGATDRLEVEEPSYAPIRTINRYGNKPRSRSREEPSSIRMTTIALFLVSTFGMYCYAVKFHTRVMQPLINATDPILRPLHNILGICGSVDQASTQGGACGSTKTPERQPVIPQPTEPPVEVASSPTPEPVATVTQPTEAYLTITSIPSGAEIWIDNKFTGLTTTNRVTVPATRPFSLKLRRQGFVEYHKPDIDMRTTPPQMTVTLLENKLAYLDVELIPPKNSRLYINGVANSEPVPRKRIAVPADTTLTLKVEDGGGNTAEYVQQPMKQNTHKRVVLHFKERNN